MMDHGWKYKKYDSLLFAPHFRRYVTTSVTSMVTEMLAERPMLDTPVDNIDDKIFVDIATRVIDEDSELVAKLMKKPGFVATRMVVSICKQAARDLIGSQNKAAND